VDADPRAACGDGTLTVGISAGPAPAMPTEEEIRTQLRKVPEPCALLMRTPLDICEMGLVDEISCGGGTVRVELVLTDTSCAHYAGLRGYITDVLLELPGVQSVEVTISTTKLWTPDRRDPLILEATE
jgi:metal-sulfur cluster biosynthetic enzyme